MGIGNWNIFPAPLLEDLKKGAPEARIVEADDVLLRVQAVKSDAEIPYVLEAYRITEEAMKAAFEAAEPGMTEWQLESIARQKMLELGAEGMPYPSWVCSGRNTALSLCRSTDRKVEKNELIQFTFGTKYIGYCGNMCRPFCFGSIPDPCRKLMDVALEAMEYTLGTVKPGFPGAAVFDGYHAILSKYGFENFTLYGPAHGTGSSEVEGLWLAKAADFNIQPGMLFNIDIWLSDGTWGLRFEDGILVTSDGLKELTSYRREAICL
jgi:Xaa-Pro aminopeptidase